MKKKLIRTAVILAAFAVLISFVTCIPDLGGYSRFYPDYGKVDLSSILAKENFDAQDYSILLHQTGLGQLGVDSIIQEPDGADQIIKFQEDFFAAKQTACRKNLLITGQEIFIDEGGNAAYGFNLAPYKDGDVLLTKSAHSLGWRHGHAGIVIDEVSGRTLESVVIGEKSRICDINSWRCDDTFILLRLKPEYDGLPSKISKYAQQTMVGIPYRLTGGLTGGTHCAHLIWSAYLTFGLNIDSNKGLAVVPKDIANSALFDVVQVYGVNPDELWK